MVYPYDRKLAYTLRIAVWMKNDVLFTIVALAPGATHTQEGSDEAERYFKKAQDIQPPYVRPSQLCLFTFLVQGPLAAKCPT